MKHFNHVFELNWANYTALVISFIQGTTRIDTET